MIEDITQRYYPNLEGAVLKEYTGDDVPKDIVITESNVYSSGDNKLTVIDPPHWGWDGPQGFSGGFSSPQQAIEDYNYHLGDKNDTGTETTD